jgi:hypothetical protein
MKTDNVVESSSHAITPIIIGKEKHWCFYNPDWMRSPEKFCAIKTIETADHRITLTRVFKSYNEVVRYLCFNPIVKAIGAVEICEGKIQKVRINKYQVEFAKAENEKNESKSRRSGASAPFMFRALVGKTLKVDKSGAPIKNTNGDLSYEIEDLRAGIEAEGFVDGETRRDSLRPIMESPIPPVFDLDNAGNPVPHQLYISVLHASNKAKYWIASARIEPLKDDVRIRRHEELRHMHHEISLPDAVENPPKGGADAPLECRQYGRLTVYGDFVSVMYAGVPHDLANETNIRSVLRYLCDNAVGKANKVKKSDIRNAMGDKTANANWQPSHDFRGTRKPLYDVIGQHNGYYWIKD